ncbi:MAG: hypothetical protein RLZZ223_290 [Candidatus Parcubacteria bacterium]|jgi:hypothetical protein
MPEIHNNSENSTTIERPQPNIENNNIDRGFETPRNIENYKQPLEQPSVEQGSYSQAEQHIRQVVEVQKNFYQNNYPTKVLSPKLQEKYGWLISIPEEHRVEVSVKLITTKGKDLLDVIHAFLAIEDYVALDRLEESLSQIYPTLVQEGLLPDVHDK